MLLTQTNDDCRDVHDRMPVIIEQDHVEDWLSGGPPQNPNWDASSVIRSIVR